MSQDTKLAEAVETLLLHFGRGAASEKGVVDDELKDLLTEAAEHAAERRASIARKEQVLLDLLTSDISETSEAGSMSSSAAEGTPPASSSSMRPGPEGLTPLDSLLRSNHPDLTDQELLDLADET